MEYIVSLRQLFDSNKVVAETKSETEHIVSSSSSHPSVVNNNDEEDMEMGNNGDENMEMGSSMSDMELGTIEDELDELTGSH